MNSSARSSNGLPPFNPQTIANLLQRDKQACELLLKLFDEEQQYLKDRNVEALENLISQKSENLKILENGAQIRSVWIKAQFPNATRPTEELWLESLTTLSKDLLPQWENLQNLFKAAQEKNEINGKVLARKNEAYSRILSMLRGQGQGNNLYTAKGSSGARGGSQSLGEA